MDRDTESIGGLENPPPPSRQLYLTTIVLDIAAIILGFFVTPLFGFIMPLVYWRFKSLQLSRYPVKKISCYWLSNCYYFPGSIYFLAGVLWKQCREHILWPPWQGMLICALLIGGFYPLTQIYQHQQDLDDGVNTISYKLGYNGTFIFCAIVYLIAWVFMAQFFIQ